MTKMSLKTVNDQNVTQDNSYYFQSSTNVGVPVIGHLQLYFIIKLIISVSNNQTHHHSHFYQK